MEFVFSACSVCFFFSWRSTSSVVNSSWWPSIRKSLKSYRCKNILFTKCIETLQLHITGLTVQNEIIYFTATLFIFIVSPYYLKYKMKNLGLDCLLIFLVENLVRCYCFYSYYRLRYMGRFIYWKLQFEKIFHVGDNYCMDISIITALNGSLYLFTCCFLIYFPWTTT